MDMTVTQIGAVVVAQLRAAGYMESTIGQYAKTVKALSEFASGRAYSVDLGAEFASMTTSVRTGRFSAQRRFDYRRLVDVFDSYVCTGQVDLSVRGRGGGGPQPVVRGFVELDAAWEVEMERRGLAPATRAAYGRVARSYLVFLEGCGIGELGGADGASVLVFLESLLDKWAKSSLFWLVSNFRPFLKFTGRPDLVDALNLAGVKRSHAIIPVLGDADEELVVEACASGAVSARDAAITLLALTTGLRACDIVGMRTGDIDWRSRTIGIVQQKTGNPLTLPLPALLVGKLADYVLGERPSSADDHLFLRSGPAYPAERSRGGAQSDGDNVPEGGSGQRQGRDPAAAPQRRVAASGRGGAAADHLGRARPRQRGIDEPVYERQPGTPARLRTAGC